MVTLNADGLKISGVKESDYFAWCRSTGKPAYKLETKREFYWRIQTGRLVKDRDGHLVKKHGKKD